MNFWGVPPDLPSTALAEAARQQRKRCDLLSYAADAAITPSEFAALTHLPR